MSNTEPDPVRRVRDEFAETGVSQSSAGAPGEQAGDVIDRYKLLQAIGEGGMGTVWMAEQKEPVKRQVALKIIKLGMDTKEVVVRFEAERQALALMDHPNIAKVLDGGATDNGRPFFVMELVRGVPITQYCDEQKLGLRARLELFTKVCEAIQHAHHKGVIHRDIKPSNVMVTMHDGVPVPMVIDFGIAKATSVELTQKTLFTQYGNMIGTPEYMAPEQAEMSGLDIDTRADVYSLGVLLYELLTGSKPFDITKVLERGYQELLRTIREEEPAKPSTRVSTMGEKTSIAKAHANVGKLSSRLRGDLDWIVMRALEKDRTRRYDTANEFAADVSRYLTGDAVHAAPPSSVYRLRKFVRRNRGKVLAVTLLLLTLLLGIAGTGYGMWWAFDEKDKADQAVIAEGLAKTEAQKQAGIAKRKAEAAEAARQQEADARRRESEARERAEYVAKFVSEILAGAGPSIARGRDTTVLREMMDWAVAQIEAADAEMPAEAEVVLRHVVGRVFRELAAYDVAERLLVPGQELARKAGDGGREHLGWILIQLGHIHSERGELAQAEACAQEALEIFPGLSSGEGAGRVECLNILASVAVKGGDPAGAESRLREVLALNRRLHSGDHPGTASSATSLGCCLSERGVLTEAEPLVREGIEMYRRLYPDEDHPHVAIALGHLAQILRAKAEYAEALLLAEEGLAMQERVLGLDHPHVGVSVANYAVMLFDVGKLTEADENSRRAIGIIRSAFSGDHFETATCLQNLGTVRSGLGDFDGAERLHRESLAMLRELYSGDHPRIANVVANLAETLRSRGEEAQALPRIKEAVAMFRRIYPDDHAMVAEALAIQGETESGLGMFDQADATHEAALAMRRRLFPDGHPDVVASLLRLTTLHGERGQFRKAARIGREALETARSVYSGDHLDVAMCLGRLGAILHRLGDLRNANPLIDESIAMFERAALGEHELLAELFATRGLAKLNAGDLAAAEEPLVRSLAMAKRLYRDGSPNLISAYLSLGALRQSQEDYAAALPLLSKGLELQEKLLPPGNPDVLSVVERLAFCCWSLSRFEQAIGLYERAVKANEAAFGPKHPNTVRAVFNLGVNYRAGGRLAEALPLIERGLRDGPPFPHHQLILANAYAEAAALKIPFDREASAKLTKKVLARSRNEHESGSLPLAGQLAVWGWQLLRCGLASEAEALLRECVEIRAEKAADSWLLFNSQSLLGEALLDLGRSSDAEPLLLEGYRGMKERSAAVNAVAPIRIIEAIERLVRLYEEAGNQAEAARWRKVLVEARTAIQKK